MLRQLQEVLSRSLIIMKSRLLPFSAKKKLNLRRQAGSVVVAKRKLQQVRQEQSKYLFKSANHNSGFYRILAFLLHMSLKTFSASFVFIVYEQIRKFSLSAKTKRSLSDKTLIAGGL